jgi:hypothetical protein
LDSVLLRLKPVSYTVQQACPKMKKAPLAGRFVRSSILVELVGFEPTSKQGNHALSTCLVDHWFSIEGRGATPYLKLSHYNLRSPQWPVASGSRIYGTP